MYGSKETGSTSKERKEYKPIRFGVGFKLLAGFDLGMLSKYKEAWTASKETWKEREKTHGSRAMWQLQNFGKKVMAGYNAAGKIAEIIDDAHFKEICNACERDIERATSQEEKEKITNELENIRDLRKRFLEKEASDKESWSQILETIKSIF